MQTNTLKMIVNSKIKKQILMCAQTYFEVTYAINPAMARTLACKIAVNQFKAMEQWTGLKDIYTKEGFDVVLIDPVKGLPDMVFTANCGIVNDGRAIIGEFKHAQRKPETDYFEKWFKENDYGIIHIKEEFEGTGDMLLWKDNIIGGHGVISGLDGITKVAKFFTFLGRGKDLVPVKLVDDNYYHLDTCFCPMGENALFYPKAFSADSIEVLLEMGAMPINDKDARSMLPNGVYLDNGKGIKFIASKISREWRNALEKLGIEIILNPTSEFQKSGGSNRCLTLFL